jgi:hypothetical protein
MHQHRVGIWVVITGTLVAVQMATHPETISVLHHKITMLSLSALLGFVIDLNLFPHARPIDLSAHRDSHAYSTAMLRRGGIIAASMLAFCLGL